MSKKLPKYKKRHTVGYAVSREMQLAVQKIAASKGRSASSIVRIAITRYLKYVGNPK